MEVSGYIMFKKVQKIKKRILLDTKKPLWFIFLSSSDFYGRAERRPQWYSKNLMIEFQGFICLIFDVQVFYIGFCVFHVGMYL